MKHVNVNVDIKLVSVITNNFGMMINEGVNAKKND